MMKIIVNPFSDDDNIYYYGLIERFERVDDRYEIVIDSVRKQDFDLYVKNNGDYSLAESYTSVLYSTLSRADCKQLFASFNPYRTELRWVKLCLTKNESDMQLVVYSNTFQSEEILYFEFIAMLDPRRRSDKLTLDYLKRAYSLRNVGYNDLNEIGKIKNEINNSAPKYVAVYNVGQGNSNSLCTASNNLPVLYFDLGGGVNQNKKTYRIIKKFCIERKPIVILSHWDFDHYFSAVRSKDLQSLNWIVPDQVIGPEAFKFAQKVAMYGKLHIFNLTKALSNKVITLMKGTGKSKNDSGLILLINFRLGKREEKILLPGDCKYKHIPDIQKMILTGLVASHHGGTYKGKKYIPQPSMGRLAISYGKNNTFKHPSKEMLKEYKKIGWSQIKRTPQGNIAFGSNTKINNTCKCAGSGINIQQIL